VASEALAVFEETVELWEAPDDGPDDAALAECEGQVQR
jgi:hypothetical protein